MRSLAVIFIASLLLLARPVHAQLCAGSAGAAVWVETFGKGDNDDTGPALPGSVTSLTYAPDICGGDEGTYTLMTEIGTSCKDGIWQSYTYDHTRNGHGYMMVINAGRRPALFYTHQLKGTDLSAGTTYQLSGYISNILRELPRTRGFIQPQIKFRVETTNGMLLAEYTTPAIPATDNPGFFEQYGTCFTAPADGSDVIISLLSAVPGGDGNDFAIDDISVSPVGQTILVGFNVPGDTRPQHGCQGENLTYNLLSNTDNYKNPDIQWQQNLNDGLGWVNIPGSAARQKNYPLNLPNASPGVYQYRVGLLDELQRGKESNRIYSAPLTVTVTAAPVITLPATLNFCEGQPLQLSATGGSKYRWAGPDGWTSAESSPVVTTAATARYSGRYVLEVISEDGCSSAGSTLVTVHPAAKIITFTPGSSICAGDAVQLDVTAANALTYKWSPAAGLSNPNIANPVASPSVTTTYTVEVTAAGCAEVTDYRQITITVNQRPMADAGPAVAIFAGQQGRLHGKSSGDNVSIHWEPADYLDDAASLTPITSAPRDMVYTLHVSNISCGEQTSLVTVRVYQQLSLPNSFTPNGDGINDLWIIGNLDTYANAEVSIYNRLGQQLYYSRGYPRPWDGTLQGKFLPAGSYYYLINLHEDHLPPLSGWLLIIR